MRGLLVIVHRWAGLFIAIFLFLAGLTGSLISWDHELDEWLNPDLFEAKQSGPPLPPLELVARFEASNPQVQVTYFPLSYEAGKTAELFVVPRKDPATGRFYALDYNQVYLEPATADVRGKRFWGKVSLDRKDLLPFLYKLHYSMHIPDFYGYERWGIWLMGIVGIVWTFDCFVGLWLTFPPFKRVTASADPTSGSRREKTWFARWAPAWRIKTNASAYRLNFDVHRAAGLWAWLFLLILAFTSISMNLGDDIVRPVLGKVFTLTPDAEDTRTPAPIDKPIEAQLSFASIVNAASDEAAKRQWQDPLGSAYYNPQTGIYSISFFEAGAEHGTNGMEPKALYFDGNTGAVLGDSAPWAGTAADIFMQLQFPLHSGRIAGMPGRIFLTIMGIVVAVLSFTGIVIWFKKRLARLKGLERSKLLGDLDKTGMALVSPAGGYRGSAIRFFHRFGDEDNLRLRLAELGKKAASASTAPEALPLLRLTLLYGAAALLFVDTLFVAARRIFNRGYRFVAHAWTLGRSLGAVLFSRNFWEAGRLDIQSHMRWIMALVGR